MIRICWSIVVLNFAGACLVHAAEILADWTYQTSQPSSSGAATYGPVIPETGSGSATGVHSISTTAWSTPSGNGSSHSFNANDWSMGDYFQFQTSTVGYQNINAAWDQASSGTGPTGFKLQYSADGSTFFDFATYAVNIDSTSWSASSTTAADHYSYDLSTVTGLDNDAAIYFRLVQTSSTGSGTGTDRNDNFTISGDPVPEPAAWGAIAGAGLIVLCCLRARQYRRCGENLNS